MLKISAIDFYLFNTMVKRATFVLGMFLGILVLVGGYWYIMRSGDEQERDRELLESFRNTYRTAESLRREGKIEEAHQAYLEALEKAPARYEELDTKLGMASNLFMRNQGDDRIRAVEIHKEIITDESLPTISRSLAVVSLINLHIGTHDDEFAREVIFIDEPFESFLEEGDISLAVRRLSEMADKLYPLSMSHFLIGAWYAEQLRRDDLSEVQRTQYFSQLKEWTEKGESYLPESLIIGYGNHVIGYIYMLQAIDRWHIARFSDEDYSFTEDAFKRSLQALALEKNVDTFGVELYVRFYYAILLTEAYGEERPNDIATILEPVINPPPEFQTYPFLFNEFLEGQQYKREDDPLEFKDEIIRLQEVSPEFRSFLEERGLRYGYLL